MLAGCSCIRRTEGGDSSKAQGSVTCSFRSHFHRFPESKPSLGSGFATKASQQPFRDQRALNLSRLRKSACHAFHCRLADSEDGSFHS